MEHSVRMLATPKYWPQKGIIELTMYHAAIPVFLFLGSGYAQYGYEAALILSSKYAQLLFANLAKYRGTGIWRVSLKNLRQSVGAMEKSYDNYSALRQRVIDLSLEQINEHTSPDVSHEPMMKGRATVGIEFSIRPKTPPEELEKEEKKAEMNQRLEAMFQSDIADLVSYASNQLSQFYPSFSQQQKKAILTETHRSIHTKE